MQLDAEEELILVAGHPPMRAQKLRYFTDPRFLARVLPVPAITPPDVPSRAASPWETEGGKACLAVAPLRPPGTADEEPDDEGQVLEPAVADDRAEPDDEDADEEGYTL